MNWLDTQIRLRLKFPTNVLSKTIRADRRDFDRMRSLTRHDLDQGKAQALPEIAPETQSDHSQETK